MKTICNRCGYKEEQGTKGVECPSCDTGLGEMVENIPFDPLSKEMFHWFDGNLKNEPTSCADTDALYLEVWIKGQLKIVKLTPEFVSQKDFDDAWDRAIKEDEA